MPMPVIFVRYGARLREKSHFARKANELMAGMRNHTPETVEGLSRGRAGQQDVEELTPETFEKKGEGEY